MTDTAEKSPSQEEAERRLRSALKRVEAAQNELNEACSEISSILGLVREWEAIGKLADQVKAFWHRLNRVHPKSGAWDLDETAKQGMWRRRSEATRKP
jgi:hypothetical protein